MRWLFGLVVAILVILGMYQFLEVDTFAPGNVTIFLIGLYFVFRAWRTYRKDGHTRQFEFALYLALIGIVFGLAILFELTEHPIWMASMVLLVIGFGVRLWRM